MNHNTSRALSLARSLVALAVAFTATVGAVSPAYADCQPWIWSGAPTANDSIVCTGVDYSSGVYAYGGNDTITVAAGATVVGTLQGGDAADTITVNAGATVGGIFGDNVGAGVDGADTILLDSVTIRGASGTTISTGGGDDSITFQGDTIVGSVIGSTTINTDGGNDTLTVSNDATLTANVSSINTGSENDTVVIGSSATVIFSPTGGRVIYLGMGNDSVTLQSDATVQGAIYLDDGNDTLTVGVGGETATISAGSGDDSLDIRGAITAQPGSSVATGIWGQDGNDTITLYSGGVITATVTGIDGGSGNDTITVGGRITAPTGIDAGAGDDTVTLQNGAVFNGLINGGSGDDTLRFAFTTGDQAAFDQFGAELSTKAPNSGTITFSGNGYTWLSFTSLQNLLTFIGGGGGGNPNPGGGVPAGGGNADPGGGVPAAGGNAGGGGDAPGAFGILPFINQLLPFLHSVFTVNGTPGELIPVVLENGRQELWTPDGKNIASLPKELLYGLRSGDYVILKSRDGATIQVYAEGSGVFTGYYEDAAGNLVGFSFYRPDAPTDTRAVPGTKITLDADGRIHIVPPGGKGELIVTPEGTVYDAAQMKRVAVIERIALLSTWEEQMQFIQNWMNGVEQLKQKQAQLEQQIAEKVKPLQAERDALTNRFASGEKLTSEEWRRYRELGAEVSRLNGIVEKSQAPVEQMGNFLLTPEEGAAWLDEIASRVDRGFALP